MSKLYFKEWNKGNIQRKSYNTILSSYLNYSISNELNLEPFYQREIVWSEEQQRKYVENIFLGKANINFHIIINKFNSEYYCEILDGKQRLTSLLKFYTNDLKIFDNISFENLNKKEKFKFETLIISIVEYSTPNLDSDISDKDKIELFLEVNELGTKMNTEHLEKIKNMKEIKI